MLNKICWRMILCKNSEKTPLSKLRLLCDISLRTISTNKPLWAVKNDKHTSVKVYDGILSSQIRGVKAFSLSSSIIGLLAQPILYKEIVSTGNIPIIVAAYSCVGFFTFVTPLLLHSITKKYVTSLEYVPEEEKYIAYTINFFCLTKKVEFKVEDVVVPDLPGMFTTLKVKGKPLFLHPSHFEDPEHYAILMGFNKPIDFKMNEQSNCDKNK
ncbi:transmembrane protein 70 homolog, mitochondrial [Coccinella septempunctata]|uniref:transmembrane protein 70 homolog, mitochondrial n=1 Tax=Coccinella septempunctata TaxID=41139 RepID=UPI001D096940|nr:transmembrane protein 70 homolog, mitochondrial [Coccinella septempunctata]